MIYRKATLQDVEPIYKLINDYAAAGVMLARSRNMLYETLRDFVVAQDNDRIVGVGALHLGWDEMAEIRAMAIAPDVTQHGIGRNIVDALTAEARQLGVKTLYALTYQPGFFAKLGFTEVDKSTLSHKVWKECINCAKFPNCDEIAMIKHLT